ncbi:hypothetical protein IKZ40_05825 [bacterium]|nr:hypothetical protein [bacterium]
MKNQKVVNQTVVLDIPQDQDGIVWQDLFLLKDDLKWNNFADAFKAWIKTQNICPFLCFLDMALIRQDDLRDNGCGVYFLVSPECNIEPYKRFMNDFLTAGYGIARSKEFLYGIFDSNISDQLQILIKESSIANNHKSASWDISCEISVVHFNSSEPKYSLNQSIDEFMRVVTSKDYAFGDVKNKCLSKVFFVPIATKVGEEKNLAQLVVGISSCADDIVIEFLRKINQFVYYYYASTHAERHAEQMKEAYTHAAIGSIMSRNGSHNIGSHVLSALSHNVGTMPDDRVLYQYIQHRMDYIATATTEFPQWTTPTMLVGGVMKNFYAQKHLLDYISRSEGLRAYKFQERNLDDATRMNQHGTIRLFLRRFFDLARLEKDTTNLPDHRHLVYDFKTEEPWSIYPFFGERAKMFRRVFSTDKHNQYEVSEAGGTAKFLEYDERFTPDWKQDVRIAIPGGIVGQHAFYTIIENVIRNAAKHGWAAEQNRKEKDLEINIDFCEDQKREQVVFVVGDNVSDVFGGARQFWKDFFEWFDSIEKWREFCVTSKRQQLLDAIRDAAQKNVDGEHNLWKDVQSLWAESEKSGMVGEEECKDKCKKVVGLIVKIFCCNLDKDEAEALEKFLRPEEKDKPVTDKEVKQLPVAYQLQREFLRESIADHNVDLCIIETKDSDGKKTLQWRDGENIKTKIRDSIFKETKVTNFGRSLVEDKRFCELCNISYEWSEVYRKILMLSGKDERGYYAIPMEISKAFNSYKIEPSRLRELGQNHEGKDISDISEYVIWKFLWSHIDNTWKYKNFLSNNNPQYPDWDLGRRLILPLHHDQHRKLAQSFIKSDGTLRPENWGLAEMKISAGFLGHRSVSEIGGLSAEGNNILVPIAMPGVCRNADNLHNCIACSFKDKRDACYSSDPVCPLRNHRFHLGYRFSIATPKDILLVFKEVNGLKSIRALIDKLRGKGIHCAYAKAEDSAQPTKYYFITDKGVDEVKNFNYRFVVTEENDDSKRFVFRHIEHDRVVVKSDENGKGEQLFDYLKNIGDLGENQILEIRKAVLSAWVKKLSKKFLPNQEAPVKLVLNVTGNENGKERGLVTTKDLLQTMFLECYHTALISFIKNPPESLDLSDTSRHLITLLSLIKIIPDKMVKSQQDYGHGDDYGAKEYIRKQLVAYCDLLKSHLLLSVQFIDALKSIERYVKDEEGAGDAEISREIESIGKDFEKAIARRLFRAKLDEDEVVRRECEQLIAFLRKVDKKALNNLLDAFHGAYSKYPKKEDSNSYSGGRHSFEDNLRAIIKACAVPEEYEFDALVESLNSMFLASDVYLRKYEERIATLPEAYKHDGSEEKQKEKTSGEITPQKMVDELLGTNSEASSGSMQIIKYSRHDRSKPENAIYSEALSGSQSYLNALSRLSFGKANKPDELYALYAGIARLLENAFLRILIIDERVMNFVNDRTSDEMKQTFINMGIWVADVQNPRPAQDRDTVTDSLYGLEYDTQAKTLKIPEGQFDVIIIHQGIIDKWWGQAKHDRDNVKKILDNIREKCHIPWVVVTTGRGRPENIPEDEKVLPFSVIESSLFRRYPEKLILVNTIMNLLPYGNKDEKK